MGGVPATIERAAGGQCRSPTVPAPAVPGAAARRIEMPRTWRLLLEPFLQVNRARAAELRQHSWGEPNGRPPHRQPPLERCSRATTPVPASDTRPRRRGRGSRRGSKLESHWCWRSSRDAGVNATGACNRSIMLCGAAERRRGSASHSSHAKSRPHAYAMSQCGTCSSPAALAGWASWPTELMNLGAP